MPTSSPESTIPTLRVFSSGVEYCAASGMKRWGMTEQTPIGNESPCTASMRCATAVPASAAASSARLTTTIRRRLIRSASGMTKSSPRA